ncbi:hypothetical protein D4A47_06240 [Anaerotruncus massiliensis (ex Liu et al. 2021)]|uniref:Leucine-rich repeat domain-containing protein n=2 Tax=Anaerotruncus TaxID=244127 RepID=A0A498CZB8_9FIRM|nr:MULTISPECIES: leucine-rich repeat domain-containing protein [Anaerotruncus]RLL12123.1 hypothetical protein D4A47_06240 [Anaerotruncus massiliensis (ex Liu et al. 2021)]
MPTRDWTIEAARGIVGEYDGSVVRPALEKTLKYMGEVNQISEALVSEVGETYKIWYDDPERGAYRGDFMFWSGSDWEVLSGNREDITRHLLSRVDEAIDRSGMANDMANEALSNTGLLKDDVTKLQEDFTSVADGKALVETAISDMGGTVSKAADVATFQELADGVGTISGDGAGGELKVLIERTTAPIAVPEGTARIGDFAFYKYIGLHIDHLPDGIITIGDSAFRESDITLTTLPESMTEVKQYAFYSCVGLALTHLPANINYIRRYSFYKCVNLDMESLPEATEKIEDYGLYGCTKLALTSLPSKLKSIGVYALSNCTNLGLTEINIESIGDYALSGCTKLQSIKMGGRIKSISGRAFVNCDNLVEITCDFAEGAVANAPWGATKATITYLR